MSRGHKIIQNFLRKRGAWDNNPYKDAKPKEKEMEPKKIKEATVKIKQPGYNPPEQETIMNKEAEPAVKAAANAGVPRFVDLSGIVKKDKKVAEEVAASVKAKNYNPGKPEDRKDSAQLDSVKADTNRTVDATGEAKAKRSNSGPAEDIKQNDSSKSIKDLMANLGIENKAVQQEAVNTDTKKEVNRLGHQAGTGISAGKNIVDKSGAVHSPMSRARHLARLGMQMAKINPKLAESWDEQTLSELKKSTLASYVNKAASDAASGAYAGKEYTAQSLQHTAAGDWEASKKKHDQATKEFNRANKRLANIPKATTKLAKEETKVYDPLSKTMVARKPIKVQAGGGATRNGVPVETGASKHKSDKKLSMSQAAGVLAAESTVDVIDEISKTTLASYVNKAAKDSRYSGQIATDFENQADKSRKQSKKDSNERLHRKYLEKSWKREAGIAKAVDKLTKEETVNELKASTLQSYSDKAHQQAMDATYDAAHLNRPGEEKFKADAKKLAAKRAGGVQMAQTKLDKMKEELEDQKPMTFAHGVGDIVTCKRTHRDAVVQSVEGDNYTVVYADGSTQTGPGDWWNSTKPVTEARVVEQPRGWNVKHLKPAGHGIVGKKVRSYDFPGMHDSHYIEGHVTDEDPHSYHIRTTKVVRHNKEEPISSHMMHIRAPKGISLFGGSQGVYYAPREQKPVAKPNMRTLRGKK